MYQMFKYFLSPVYLTSDSVTELTIWSCIFCFQKPNTTIRLFDKTDFFVTYGPDAVYVATEIYKSVTCLKHIGQGKSN